MLLVYQTDHKVPQNRARGFASNAGKIWWTAKAPRRDPSDLRDGFSSFIKLNQSHSPCWWVDTAYAGLLVIVDAGRRSIETARVTLSNLVHGSVRHDDGLTARHASLIRSHLLGGFLAAIVFATYFVSAGAPTFAAGLALAAFLSPLAIAAYLSQAGRLNVAHALTAAQLAAIIVLAASLSGGSASFAVAWLLLVPVEAALSADRRMMYATAAIAILAFLGLHAATVSGILPAVGALTVDPAQMAVASHLAGVGYAAALVASVQSMHREARRQIEESRAAYELIAENTSDLITRHDPAGRVSYASRAGLELVGKTPAQLCGYGFADMLSAEDQRRYRQAFAWCHATGQPSVEVYRLDRDGAPLWIEMRCRRASATPGAREHDGTIIAVTRDITASRLQSEREQEGRVEAEKSSRAKSAFIAAMSHELRTPLNAIIGFAELLHRELLIKAREPKHAEYCRIIHESGEHLLSLVRDLLDVSKIEAGKLSTCAEPFNLNGVVKSSVDTLRPTAMTKGLTINFDTVGTIPEIVADRRACKQILINLLSNACKFTPEGGRIAIGLSAAENAVCITVRDSGIGVAPADIARLGEPFFQADAGYARNHEGAGLGLTIVRGLVSLQKGRLFIDSTPGEGSTFSVVLPIDVEAADDDAEGLDLLAALSPPRSDQFGHRELALAS